MEKLASCLLLLFSIFAKAQSVVPQARPNIVFILADDMGWTDCSVYGSQYYETPQLERLAKQGTVFTNYHTVNPLCSPTRASILTGRYPIRFQLFSPSGHLPPNPAAELLKAAAAPWKKMIDPESRTFMPLEETTLAEVLQKQGYHTGFIGKWHLGSTDEYAPERQGFMLNVAGGKYPSPPNYFSPYKIHNLPDGPDKEYITDRLTKEALNYLDQHQKEPFFLCLWHYTPHAPFQGKVNLTQKYAQKKDPSGRHDFPIMGSMLESLDESVGHVLDKLEELGLAENTIVIFTSDNGGNMYDLVGPKQYPTNNAPLKLGKGNIHEGGVRVPLIIRYPPAIKAGTKSELLVSSIDFFPTLLRATRSFQPKNLVLDGEDLFTAITKGSTARPNPVFCHFPRYTPFTLNTPATSVIWKNYKLIRLYGEGPDRSNAYELYNLETDIGEANNLALQHPKLVHKLDQLITQHLTQTGGIIPILNPAYDPQVPTQMGKQNLFPMERFPSY